MLYKLNNYTIDLDKIESIQSDRGAIKISFSYMSILESVTKEQHNQLIDAWEESNRSKGSNAYDLIMCYEKLLMQVPRDSRVMPEQISLHIQEYYMEEINKLKKQIGPIQIMQEDK